MPKGTSDEGMYVQGTLVASVDLLAGSVKEAPELVKLAADTVFKLNPTWNMYDMAKSAASFTAGYLTTVMLHVQRRHETLITELIEGVKEGMNS